LKTIELLPTAKVVNICANIGQELSKAGGRDNGTEISPSFLIPHF
jgi:hypothetical protein